MRKIPPELNERMNQDLFYERCCLTGSRSEKIDRHHNLIFAGRQQNELWAILPIAKSVHDKIPGNKKLRELCDWVMLCRATDNELRPYCKVINYIERKNYFMARFGIYTPQAAMALTSAIMNV